MTDIIDNAGGHRQNRYHDEGDGTFSESESSHLRAWDSVLGQWVRVIVDHATGGLITSGGASGGGATTIADGADVAQGTTTDVAWVSGAGTVIAILKAIKAAISGPLTVATHAVTQSGTWTVGLSANTPDVTDRAARLLGHVTVDSAPTTAVTMATQTPDVTDRAARLLGHVTVDSAPTTAITAASLPLPTGASTAANQSTVKAASAIAVATDTASVVQHSPQRADASTLWVTALSAANTTVTLTLPAAAAGLFHYITHIEIVNLNPTTTAIAASATTLSYTTTNLPGSPAFSCGNALGAGATFTVANFSPSTPIKSSVAATGTTIVAPAIGTGGLVRMNVTYYTAP